MYVFRCLFCFEPCGLIANQVGVNIDYASHLALAKYFLRLWEVHLNSEYRLFVLIMVGIATDVSMSRRKNPFHHLNCGDYFLFGWDVSSGSLYL